MQIGSRIQQIDHRVIKFLVGLIALALPLIVQSISTARLSSISEAYYTNAHDWFVGLLFAVSALILAFTGENKHERKLTILASILAAMIALVPCREGTETLHYVSTFGLFLILGYFCWRFRQTAKSKIKYYPEANRRASIYRLCLAGMLGCYVAALANVFLEESIRNQFPRFVYWVEVVGLASFGISWLMASRTFPYVTNVNERYRFNRGRAEDDKNLGKY